MPRTANFSYLIRASEMLGADFSDGADVSGSPIQPRAPGRFAAGIAS
jgi:hypothetical protein